MGLYQQCRAAFSSDALKNIIFAIDGNFYLHRCWFTLRTNLPIAEALSYAICSLIFKDACAVKATHILLAFDGPAVFRYKIYPKYKANRKEKKSRTKEELDDGSGADIYSYLPMIRKYLEASGLIWIQPKQYEADDVLASAGSQYASLKDTKVIMGSRDKDGYQCLRENVLAYDSTQDPPQYITKDIAEKKKGIKVEHMVMYQTLIGDKIDNIPSLMKPSLAKKAIDKWGSFKKWYKEDKTWLITNQVALRLNKQLVEMKTDINLPNLEELKIQKLERNNMPKSWYSYQSLIYPRSAGLFKR
jgi:5'-3' exonuclease